MRLSNYQNSDLRESWFIFQSSRVSFDNLGVLGPGGTIPVCLFNDIFYKWPLYIVLINNYTNLKNQSFYKYY